MSSHYQWSSIQSIQTQSLQLLPYKVEAFDGRRLLYDGDW